MNDLPRLPRESRDYRITDELFGKLPDRVAQVLGQRIGDLKGALVGPGDKIVLTYTLLVEGDGKLVADEPLIVTPPRVV